MASKEPEEATNTATDEETTFKKKRARRVSFAEVEITSVHIFKRDDEYGTPPEPQFSPEIAPPDNEVLGFFKDLVDSDDSRESSPNVDDDDDVIRHRKSFLRPLGSPSPGSSNAGSATSNDEDNFFGPVSANFIRPGRLSDSSANDDIPDVTMDSTAFSMHFRSLAGSDSGRDLKTPTAVRLAFEERTPTQNTNPANPDSFMTLTMAMKLTSPSLKSDVVRSKDSSEMSLVGENSHKFDYGRLSPALDALLTEGSKDLYAISVNEKPPKDHEVCEVDQMECGRYDKEISGITEMENGGKEYTKHTIEMGNSKFEEVALNNGTPHKALPSNGLLQENLSDGRVKVDPLDRGHERSKYLDYKLPYISPQKTFFAATNSPALAALVTPNSKLLDYSLESMKFGKDLSSKQKSISKLRLPEPSPCVSSIKEGNDRLRSRLSSYSSVTDFSDQLDGFKDLQRKHVDIPVVRLEEQLFSSDLSNAERERIFNVDSIAFEILKDIPKSNQNEEINGSAEVEQTANFSKMKPSKPAIEVETPSQVTWSREREVIPHILMSKNPMVGLSASFGIDALSAETTPDNREKKNSLVSSSLESLDVRLSGATKCQTSCSGELKQLAQQVKHSSDGLMRDRDADASTSTTMSPLTSMADKLSSFPFGSRVESTPPFLKAFSLTDRADSGGVNLSNLKNNSETFNPLHPSLRDGGILNSQLRSAARRFKVGTASPKFQKAQTSEPSPMQSISKGVLNYSPKRIISIQTSGKELIESATSKKSILSPSKKEQSQSSAEKEPLQSPLRNELSNETQDDMTFLRKDRHSPTSCLGGYVAGDFDHTSHILNSSSGKANHSLSGNKRRNINTTTLDGDHNDIIVMIQQSPKVNYSGGRDVKLLPEQPDQINNGSEKNVNNKTFMDWTDMSVKFSEDTKNLLPSLIDELNSKAIEKLEDTLVHLLKVKEYELLCSEIQSQKVADNSTGMHKR